MIKKLTLPLLAVAAIFSCFTFTSCVKDTPFDFDINLDSMKFTIDTCSTAGYKQWTDKAFTSNLEAQLNAIGASLQDLKSCQLKNYMQVF